MGLRRDRYFKIPTRKQRLRHDRRWDRYTTSAPAITRPSNLSGQLFIPHKHVSDASRHPSGWRATRSLAFTRARALWLSFLGAPAAPPCLVLADSCFTRRMPHHPVQSLCLRRDQNTGTRPQSIPPKRPNHATCDKWEIHYMFSAAL